MVLTDGRTDNLDSGGRGPCGDPSGVTDLYCHTHLTDQEHPKKALELEHIGNNIDIAYIRLGYLLILVVVMIVL